MTRLDAYIPTPPPPPSHSEMAYPVFASSNPTADGTVSPERKIYVNTGYLRSLHGILKIVHMVRLTLYFIQTGSSLATLEE